MKSLSGFWAGLYKYSQPNLPEVKFDCEFIQRGPSVTGHITEADVFKPSRNFLMEAVIDGQIHKREFCFTKTYVTGSDYYTEPVEYVGRVNLTGNRISGRWYIGHVSGIFILTRDKVSPVRAKTRAVANDSFLRRNYKL